MDSDINFDEKLGNCRIKLDELRLSVEPTPVSRQIDEGVFGRKAHVFVALAYDPDKGPQTYTSSAVGFWQRMDSRVEGLQGTAVDKTGDVVEFVDDGISSMPIVIGEFVFPSGGSRPSPSPSFSRLSILLRAECVLRAIAKKTSVQ